MSTLLPIDFVSRLEGASDEDSRLRGAAEAFEALLVQTLLRRMREAQLENGFFGDGPGSSIYESMFEQHLSESLSRDSPFGIAKMLEQQWRADGVDADGIEQTLRALDAEQAARTYKWDPQVFMGITDE